MQELGHRITAVTDDPRKTGFLFQQLSVAPQRGMGSPSAALSPPNKRRSAHFAFTTVSSARWLSTGGLKVHNINNNNNNNLVYIAPVCQKSSEALGDGHSHACQLLGLNAVMSNR